MNNYDLIDEILAKAAPDSALPEHVRREMRKAKKTILVNILKNAGTYTAFTALVINAVLLSKKIGLGVSAVKVQIAVKAFIAVMRLDMIRYMNTTIMVKPAMARLVWLST